jgi:hypothetical protein
VTNDGRCLTKERKREREEEREVLKVANGETDPERE